jgi:HSP20 family protein
MAKKKGKKKQTTKKGKKKKTTGKEKKEDVEISVRKPATWELMDIGRTLDEEFENFRRNLSRSIWGPRWWGYPMARRAEDLMWGGFSQPAIDVKDTGEEYVVEAELPGIPKEDINVELTRNSIKIHGEKRMEEETEDEGYYKRERSYSSFYRDLPLPEHVKPDAADATFNNGVLEIRLPKENPTHKEKPQKVKIK